MDWQDEYKSKLITAAEAAAMIKSGDKVLIPPVSDPPALSFALAARKNDLRNVEITMGGVPAHDAGWYNHGDEASFPLNVYFTGNLTRRMLDAKRADFVPFTYSVMGKPLREMRPDRKQWDWFLQVFSPPDKYGYCTYGNQIWWRKSMKGACKKIIGEIDANQIRTYGENYIHISEIDYFVENTQPRPEPVLPLEIFDHSQPIADYVSTLVNDGDTLQMGTGTATDAMMLLGAFDNKHDLGVHTEVTTHGMIDLVKKGVITGKRKTINTGKVTATCFWPEPGALDYVDMNPMFELYDVSYTNNPRVIASYDNMVSINTVLTIDLSGQIVNDSIGPRMWSAPGGQLDFCLGATYSKGGRYIAVLPSTVEVKGQRKSRIVPQLDSGSYVMIPRVLTDIVVTEFGIARLLNKSYRERANELIAIAHPDFRAELKKAAQKLHYP
ncbi:MAG: acetyl-CoA hydrolase/transferase C-terminal domain-containing protein [Dehalococcoidia bacterium]|nr:acetyl-CoA hydrolase/transferase C-terminal domain-containing protein [Dehalococcoidia bacterium]